MPVLHFATPPLSGDAPGTFRVAPLFSPPLPLDQQKPFYLILCIEFYEAVPPTNSKTENEGKHLKSKLVRLRIVPEAKKNRYWIRQHGIFPWWSGLILPTTKS
jgi:hypothetical protein